MNKLPIDIVLEILRYIPGDEIIALKNEFEIYQRICSIDIRFNSFWSEKVYLEFGERKKRNCFEKYNELYDYYETVLNYPEISMLYKKSGLNCNEKEFIDDILDLKRDVKKYPDLFTELVDRFLERYDVPNIEQFLYNNCDFIIII